MAEWLWEARAESLVLIDAIDSVMNQLQNLFASEPNDASRRFRIRICIEESLVQNSGIMKFADDLTPHTVEVRSNRREFTVGIGSIVTRFAYFDT